MQLRGMKQHIAKALYDDGYKTIVDLSRTNVETVARIISLSTKFLFNEKRVDTADSSKPSVTTGSVAGTVPSSESDITAARKLIGQSKASLRTQHSKHASLYKPTSSRAEKSGSTKNEPTAAGSASVGLGVDIAMDSDVSNSSDEEVCAPRNINNDTEISTLIISSNLRLIQIHPRDPHNTLADADFTPNLCPNFASSKLFQFHDFHRLR